MLHYHIQLKANPDFSEEGKEKVEAYLNDLFSGLEITAEISWSDFADGIIVKKGKKVIIKFVVE